MGLIPESHKKRLVEEFERNLKDEARILMFTQENECAFCKQACMQGVTHHVCLKCIRRKGGEFRLW